MLVQSSRFGEMTVSPADLIQIPGGVLGFPDEKTYVLFDPGDDTLILWLQSTTNPKLAFPVLEPRIFKGDYRVRLSGSEARELKIQSLGVASVLSILTIPSNLSEMTANLKAPIVINPQLQIAKQVVLQENDLPIQFPMFKELRAALLQMRPAKSSSGSSAKPVAIPLKVSSLNPSPAIEQIPASAS